MENLCDFTSKPKPSKFVFQGLDFNIKNVYKGDVSEQIITAGIDYNDVAWAEEFQNEDKQNKNDKHEHYTK